MRQRIPILLVDDDAGLRELLTCELEEALPVQVTAVGDCAGALAALRRQSVSLLLLDYRLPDGTASDLLDQLKGESPPFLVMTGATDAQTAVALMKRGALDYLVKDKQFRANLLPVVGRLVKQLESGELISASQLQATQQLQYRTIFEATNTGIFVLCEETGRILQINAAGCRLLGRSRAESLGMAYAGVFSEFPEVGATPLATRLRLRTQEGTLRSVEATLYRTELADLSAIVVLARDPLVDPGVELEQRLAMLVFQHSPGGIVVCDEHEVILAANPAFSAITGYSLPEVLGQTPRLLKSGRQSESFYRDLWTELLNNGIWQGFLWNRRKNGDCYYEWLTILRVEHPAPCYIGIFEDRTEELKARESLEYQSQHDSLTGLPNRLLLRDRIGQAVASAHRSGLHIALLFLDLDHFKLVNDSLGHSEGDSLLVEVARRLESAVRQCDTVCRLGGDEFALLLTELETPTEAALVAERVLQSLQPPLPTSSGDWHSSASLGIAIGPEDGTEFEDLLKHADSAMYAAKEAGRARYSFFTKGMDERAQARLSLDRELRQAVARREFTLFYQGQFDLVGNRLLGSEALIRWNHPVRGCLAPGAFLSVLEDSGMILDVGDWIIEEACRQQRAWQDAGFAIRPVAINVSSSQLRRGHLLDILTQALARHQLSADDLELEITESMLLDIPTSEPIVRSLAAAGFRIWLDDFGTGHSNLKALQGLEIFGLKVDRSFVNGVPSQPRDCAIVEMLMFVAQRLQHAVVAEGIEQAAQAEFLQGLGCQRAQGYLYHRPQAPGAFEALLGRPPG